MRSEALLWGRWVVWIAFSWSLVGIFYDAVHIAWSWHYFVAQSGEDGGMSLLIYLSIYMY